ncbi:hypothetical protein LTR97_003155 [Elasticomyces elasticus]|uniref:Mid2 domain-containing protein n=1 Tax=Elasticomyces elasticus TaxID=574655 RepID=A0AAN8A4S3_9PEZI|nr:hypothetical protein LTR97_003155 [Elasticomyces elasticus]
MTRTHSFGNAAIIVISFLAAAANGQTLQFTEPAANALTSLGATTNYTLGEDVRIAWQTPYEVTTLRVWQGPRADGSLAGQTLAENYTQSDTSFTWTAAQVGGILLSRPFRLELSNGADSSCDGCKTDSPVFYVNRPRVASSSASPSTRSSSSSAAATSTSAPTTSASPYPTSDVAGASATTPAPPASQHSNRHALSLGLGLGLGLGIPLLLALLAICAFCLLRRRKKQRRSANLPRGHQPKPSISKPFMAEQENAPGVFGDPGHPQAAYFERYGPRDERRDRDSAGTTSTTASTRHGPFEFEQPNSEQQFDSIGFVREIQGIPRASESSARTGRTAVASSMGNNSLRSTTPKSDQHLIGAPRLSSIDEVPPFRASTPEWPLRS